MTTQLNFTVPSTRPLPLRARRFSAATAGAALFTAVLTAALPSFAAASAPPAPKVTVAPVEEKILAEYEEFTGRVDATETVELRARVSGHLESVNFRSGQLVAKGDVLFRIDPRWYQAQFDLANSHAAVAEREAKRADELLEAAAISSEEAEARRARAAEARAALVTARLDLEHTEVRAPIGGRVSRAFVTAGNLISGAPGNATLLTTIVSVGESFVYADIDEAVLLKFNRLQREGRLATVDGRVPVEMQLADENGYPRRGFIESADNHLNPSTGSLVLRMIFPNDDQALLPGMFARVRIPIDAPQSTLLIAERAIGTDQSQKFVLAVAQDNIAVYRAVKLGGSADGKRVVRSGLKPGDRVIVNGLQRVRPGMAVDPEVAAAVTSTGPVATPTGAAVTAVVAK